MATIKSPFVRCGIDCLGLCTYHGETCPDIYADDNRPWPSEHDEIAGALRMVKHDQIVMNSAGQIYSAAPDRRDNSGELPDKLVINVWRALWQGLLVADREPDMVYEFEVSGSGESYLATANRDL